MPKLTNWKKDHFGTRGDLMAAVQGFDTAAVSGLYWKNPVSGAFEPTDYVGIKNERFGRVVNAASERYSLVQNPDLADMAVRVLESVSGQSVGDADFWSDGDRMFLGLYTDQEVRFGGDLSGQRIGLGFVNSFDGSTKIEVGGINRRVVCDNTLQMFRSEVRARADANGNTADAARWKHTAKETAALEDALMATAETAFKGVRDFSHALAESREVVVSIPDAHALLKKTLGQRHGERAADLLPRYTHTLGLTQESGWKRDDGATTDLTRWSLLNAATDYASNSALKSLSPSVRDGLQMTARDLLTVQV